MRDQRPMKGLQITLHACGLGLALVVGAIYFGGVHSRLKASAEADATAAAHVANRLKRADSVVKQHAAVCARLDQLTQQITSTQARIPLDPEVGEFMVAVSDCARLAGVNIADYHRSEVTALDQCASLEISLRCESGYPELCRFLEQVNSLDRIVTVNHLALQAHALQPSHSIELRLRIYHQQRNAGKITSAL